MAIEMDGEEKRDPVSLIPTDDRSIEQHRLVDVLAQMLLHSMTAQHHRTMFGQDSDDTLDEE